MSDLPLFRDMKTTSAKLDKEFKQIKHTVQNALIDYGIKTITEDDYPAFDAKYMECKKGYASVKENLLKLTSEVEDSIEKQNTFLQLNNALCFSIEEELEELEMHLKTFNYEPLNTKANKKESTSQETDSIKNLEEKDQEQEGAEKVAETRDSTITKAEANESERPQKSLTPRFLDITSPKVQSSISGEDIASRRVENLDATPVFEGIISHTTKDEIKSTEKTPVFDDFSNSQRGTESDQYTIKDPVSHQYQVSQLHRLSHQYPNSPSSPLGLHSSVMKKGGIRRKIKFSKD